MLSFPSMPPPQASRRFLLFLTVGSIALFVWVVWPFASPLLVAATIAAVLQPLHARLTAAFKGREGLSAAAVTLGTFLAIVGPLAFLASTVVQQVVSGVHWLRGALDSQGVAGLMERLPARCPAANSSEWRVSSTSPPARWCACSSSSESGRSTRSRLASSVPRCSLLSCAS